MRSVLRPIQRLYSPARRFSVGFAPRTLDNIVKLPLLEQKEASEVETIWRSYHAEKDLTFADVWQPKEYEAIKAAGQVAPLFIYPVKRPDASFVMLSQVHHNHALFTFLDDYKKNPEAAPYYLALSFYDDFAASKGIVLVRGEITPSTLSEDEAQRLLRLFKTYYKDKPDDVRAFNAGKFDFQTYLENTD